MKWTNSSRLATFGRRLGSLMGSWESNTRPCGMHTSSIATADSAARPVVASRNARRDSAPERSRGRRRLCHPGRGGSARGDDPAHDMAGVDAHPEVEAEIGDPRPSMLLTRFDGISKVSVGT